MMPKVAFWKVLIIKYSIVVLDGEILANLAKKLPKASTSYAHLNRLKPEQW